MPNVIDGKAVAEAIRHEIAASVLEFYSRNRKRPRLTAVIVGKDPASHIYVRNKIKACNQVGIESESFELAEETSEDSLLEQIRKLNESPDVDGILLQLPLPAHMNKTRILDSISPEKDVDGLHPSNVGLLVQGRASLIACTPLGVIEALRRYQISLTGKNAVIVGRSDLVGKPLALLLMHENATVTICHSKTVNLPEVVSRADVVVAAIGKAAFLTPEYIKRDAVIADVGINVLKTEEEVIRIFGSSGKKIDDFRQGKSVLVGDVHPDSYTKSSMYTPVPGGIGPLTIAMLLRNTLVAAKMNSELRSN